MISQHAVDGGVARSGPGDPHQRRTAALSNFLLWSGAYAELMFMDLWWPDFNKESLEKAIDAFRRRDRRFGGLGA